MEDSGMKVDGGARVDGGRWGAEWRKWREVAFGGKVERYGGKEEDPVRYEYSSAVDPFIFIPLQLQHQFN